MIKNEKSIIRRARPGSIIVASTSLALKSALIAQSVFSGFFLRCAPKFENKEFDNINMVECSGTVLGYEHMKALSPNMLELMVCKFV